VGVVLKNRPIVKPKVYVSDQHYLTSTACSVAHAKSAAEEFEKVPKEAEAMRVSREARLNIERTHIPY
jgi:hypothetical protein